MCSPSPIDHGTPDARSYDGTAPQNDSDTYPYPRRHSAPSSGSSPDRIIALYFATASQLSPVSLQRKRLYSGESCTLGNDRHGSSSATTMINMRSISACQLRDAWEVPRSFKVLAPPEIHHQITLLQTQLHATLDYIEDAGLARSAPPTIHTILSSRSKTPYAVTRALRKRMSVILSNAHQSNATAGVPLSPQNIAAAMMGFIPQIVELALMESPPSRPSSSSHGYTSTGSSGTGLLCAYQIVMDFREYFIQDELAHDLADSLLAELVRRRVALLGGGQIALMRDGFAVRDGMGGRGEEEKYRGRFPRFWDAIQVAEDGEVKCEDV